MIVSKLDFERFAEGREGYCFLCGEELQPGSGDLYLMSCNSEHYPGAHYHAAHQVCVENILETEKWNSILEDAR